MHINYNIFLGDIAESTLFFGNYNYSLDLKTGILNSFYDIKSIFFTKSYKFNNKCSNCTYYLINLISKPTTTTFCVL